MTNPKMAQSPRSKLEEFLIAIDAMPADFVDAIEKAREKERRRVARDEKLASQQREHEERLQRSLERASAPVFKKVRARGGGVGGRVGAAVVIVVVVIVCRMVGGAQPVGSLSGVHNHDPTPSRFCLPHDLLPRAPAASLVTNARYPLYTTQPAIVHIHRIRINLLSANTAALHAHARTQVGKPVMARSQPLKKKEVVQEDSRNDEEAELEAYLAQDML